MARLLITGASGFLGRALCEKALTGWDVHAVYHRNAPATPGVVGVRADLTRMDQLERLLGDSAPQAVIHAAAAADVALCETRPDDCGVLNVDVPAEMARLCARAGIVFVFTSTDLVFNGRRAPYREQDAVDGISAYGKQKARAERLVMAANADALVCRLPLMIGTAPDTGRHFFTHMLRSIMQGRPLTLFTDEYRTPVDTDSAAAGILGAMGRVAGLLHLGGKTRLSRHDLGVMICRALGVAPTMIRPASIAPPAAGGNRRKKTLNAIPGAPRAADVSLISEKAFTLGYAPSPLAVSVQRIVDRALCSLCRD